MTLDEKEVAEYLDLNQVKRTIPLGFDATPIVGKIFIVTGTGKYFKNIDGDPETYLDIVSIVVCALLLVLSLLITFLNGSRYFNPFI